MGAKKNPVWRVVVADQRSPRDGRIIETIGRYNPQTDPSTVVIDSDKAQAWIDRGAQPTKAVSKLLRIQLAGSGVASPATNDAGAPADPAPEQGPAVDGELASEATAVAVADEAPAAEQSAGDDA